MISLRDFLCVLWGLILGALLANVAASCAGRSEAERLGDERHEQQRSLDAAVNGDLFEAEAAR